MPELKSRFSVAVLLFGDYPQLARRCLRSLWHSFRSADGLVADVRIGLNEVSDSTSRLAEWFVRETVSHFRIPSLIYRCPQNAYKYPLMRRMFFDEENKPAPWFMWFDDDSYLTGELDWWAKTAAAAIGADMLGKIYFQQIMPGQQDWIDAQPWHDPLAGATFRHRGRPAFRFATGGWWAIKSSIFAGWDWPPLELIHRGGDSMLGELLRQQGFFLKDYDYGVRINADSSGAHSSAPRRPPGTKFKHPLLGTPANVVDELAAHSFECQVETYFP